MSAIVPRPIRRLVASLAVAAMLTGMQSAHAADGKSTAAPPSGALAYAQRTGALYKSDGRALYRSDDGGKQWRKVPLSLPPDGTRITSVAVSAGATEALYLAGSGLGALKSVDAGKSWISIAKGLPSQDVVALAAHSTVPETVYAMVAGRGIYRSEDGGARWRMVDKGPPARLRQFVHSNLAGSMQSGWIYTATDKGVYRAMDCFCGFRPAGTLPGKVSAVSYDPKQPTELYAAVGGQVFRTVNGGESWQRAGSPGGVIVALAYTPAGVLYTLLADGRVARSTSAGKQWE
jgi:photosystem II stability/assembly factor-like uncharacterized protein